MAVAERLKHLGEESNAGNYEDGKLRRLRLCDYLRK
jgi:hypothetical protein